MYLQSALRENYSTDTKMTLEFKLIAFSWYGIATDFLYEFQTSNLFPCYCYYLDCLIYEIYVSSASQRAQLFVALVAT